MAKTSHGANTFACSSFLSVWGRQRRNRRLFPTQKMCFENITGEQRAPVFTRCELITRQEQKESPRITTNLPRNETNQFHECFFTPCCFAKFAVWIKFQPLEKDHFLCAARLNTWKHFLI